MCIFTLLLCDQTMQKALGTCPHTPEVQMCSEHLSTHPNTATAASLCETAERQSLLVESVQQWPMEKHVGFFFFLFKTAS